VSAGFRHVRRRAVLQKAIERVDYPVNAPVAYTLVITVLGGCAMSQLPWLELFTKCWPGG